MKNSKRLLFGVQWLAMLLLFSCTVTQNSVAQQSGKVKPDWVEHPDKKYPGNRYIVGVGSGDTRQAADDNAFGNISKVFQAEVSVDETYIQKYLEIEKQGKHELSVSSQMLEKSGVKSNQNLKNIKVKEAFFAENEGLYYVLAVMDRLETADLYEQDIEYNNEKINEFLTASRQSSDKLTRFARLYKVKTIFEVNKALNQQYRLISLNQEEIAGPITELELDQEWGNLIRSINVSLHPAEGTAQEMTDYMLEVIGSIGFQVVKENSDFGFNYSLELSETQLNRPNTFGYNWKLTVRTDDNLHQRALRAFNLEQRTVSISENQARALLMVNVKKALNTQFKKDFMAYLESL